MGLEGRNGKGKGDKGLGIAAILIVLLSILAPSYPVLKLARRPNESSAFDE